MQLKVNAMYQSEKGYIIPRSKFTNDKAVPFAIFEILELEKNGHYIKRHCTLTRMDIKKALGLSKRERIEII